MHKTFMEHGRNKKLNVKNRSSPDYDVWVDVSYKKDGTPGIFS